MSELTVVGVCVCTQGLKMSVAWTMFYGVLSAFAPVYGWILFLRALVGFGIGGAPQSYVSLPVGIIAIATVYCSRTQKRIGLCYLPSYKWVTDLTLY